MKFHDEDDRNGDRYGCVYFDDNADDPDNVRNISQARTDFLRPSDVKWEPSVQPTGCSLLKNRQSAFFEKQKQPPPLKLEATIES